MIKQKLARLSLDEKKKILRLLITDHDLEHTKNTDGYFFKLSDFSQDLLKELETLIDQLVLNRENLNILEQKRLKEIEEYKRTIARNLENSSRAKREEYLTRVKAKPTAEYSNVSLSFEPVTPPPASTVTETPTVKWSTRFDYHPVYKRLHEVLKKQARLQRNIAAKMIQERESTGTTEGEITEALNLLDGSGDGDVDGDGAEEYDPEPEPEPDPGSEVEESSDDADTDTEEDSDEPEEDPDPPEPEDQELEPELEPEENEVPEPEEESSVADSEEEPTDHTEDTDTDELERQRIRLQNAGFEFNEDDTYLLKYRPLIP